VALSEEARRVRFRPTAIGLTKDDLSDAVPYADAIVNTTSMGMAGGPNPGNSPVSADLISDRSVIYDIVYAPQVTPLIHQAEQAGARGVTGLSMLVYQGVIGFELCTGQTAPAEVMLSAARVASEAM
jgi:shikimate dehydrogenase